MLATAIDKDSKTEIPNINGGSPTAFDRLIVSCLFSDQSASFTLNSRGISEASGILYVEGAWVFNYHLSCHHTYSNVNHPILFIHGM